ncbi:TPA: UDP-N-acetylmuramate dehydrogenase [Pseudomonas aeruginosa]
MKTSFDFSLREMNTFGMKVNSRVYIEIGTKEELVQAVLRADLEGWPLLVLGEGSNVLMRGDFDGAVLRLAGLDQVRIIHEDGDAVHLRVGAGLNWDRLVRHCARQGYAGLESLAGIPGTVGAAPVQNVGAYGCEVGQRLRQIEVYDRLEHGFRLIAAEDCRFSYRMSLFKSDWRERYIIVSVTFVLRRAADARVSDPKIREELGLRDDTPIALGRIGEAVRAVRGRRLPDPGKLGNAGSFFMNPIVSATHAQALARRYPQMPVYPVSADRAKISAGWLIEQCGYRGYRSGNVGVYWDNPLVVVNYGDACAAEILAFGRLLKEAVLEKFSVRLHMEPSVIG